MKIDSDILNGKRWRCDCSDALTFLRGLPDDSIDLLFTSPPYEAARTYGIGFGLKGQAWVDWMVEIVTASAPKVKGLIAVNCEGQTRQYKYSATPFLLAADLHRAGMNLRKPVVFHRVGIPGSGGPDWLRNDWEPVICVTRGKLPWSDNTACGWTPKYAPGGEMSNRTSEGVRVNDKWGGSGDGGCGKGARRADGNREQNLKPMCKHCSKFLRLYRCNEPNECDCPKCQGICECKIRLGTGQNLKGGCAVDVAVANPGNVLKYAVGGGVMGHNLAHENEAPFPLDLAAFFVKSFCPPDGITCDPFSGSGTTCHAAIENGRRFIGCDVRESQVKLCNRRMSTVTAPIPGMYHKE